MLLSSGARHDNQFVQELLQKVSMPQKRGRSRNRPVQLVADKGYDAHRIRCYLRKRGIQAVIPEKQLPEGRKRRKKGPHYKFDKDIYKERNVIERLFNGLKECRRVATRFEKLPQRFLAMLQLACSRLLLKKYFSDTL
jgi:transposase